MKLLSLTAAVAAFTLSVSAVSAATFTQDFSEPLSLGALPTADMVTGTVFQNVTGSISGIRRSPWENTTQPNAFYSSVSGGATATYDLGGTFKEFSIMWGSVDTYNTLQFLLDGNVVDTLSGAALIPPATQGLGFSVVDILPTSLFDSVRFVSGSNAFEYANLQAMAAVPLPAGGLLLVTALGAFGLVARRRARA